MSDTTTPPREEETEGSSRQSSRPMESMSMLPKFQAIVRRVFVVSSAHDTMLDHAREGDKLEAMGLLVGTTDEKKSVIMVRQAIPVIIGKEAEVEFDPKHYEVFGRDYSPFWVVGWYHSHPGYGLFLSTIDIKTHAHGFQVHNPLSVAIVVDHTRPPSSNIAAFQVENIDIPHQPRYVQVPLSIKSESDDEGESVNG